jgi:cyanate lyase
MYRNSTNYYRADKLIASTFVSTKKNKKMDRKAATELIIQSIKNKKVKFQDLAGAIGSSLIWTIHALHGQAAMDKAAAEKIGEILSLSPELVESLQEIPLRSALQFPPTDPTLYRLSEMMMNFGPDIKAAINEMFGDGAMSGIDFTLDIARVESPNGARVKLILDGKFLPFNKF